MSIGLFLGGVHVIVVLVLIHGLNLELGFEGGGWG
jgi:hypothetical protein